VAAVEAPALRKPSLRERAGGVLRPKKWLNRYAAKALQIADSILGSIPGAEAIAEIKDIALEGLPVLVGALLWVTSRRAMGQKAPANLKLCTLLMMVLWLRPEVL
jgi:hypothetical protein